MTSYIAHMRFRIARMLLLILTVVFLASGSCPASDLALVGAKIYPSPTEPPIENGSILVHQGQILAIGPARAIKIPRGATVINCKGLIVAAGFWNSHVHIFTPGLLRVRDSTAAELDEQLDTIFNRWGFTTVFDLASVLDNTLVLRRRIESDEVRGPRILTVGEPIWTIEPVYVRDYMRDNNIHIPDTETPDQAIALVRDHVAKGADGIKLFTGSLQDGGQVAILPLAVAKAAVEEAHRHGMPVFAHPQDLEGVEIAINSRVDVLAHTVPGSPPWTPEFIARLKTANLALIPTLTLWDFEARKIQGTDQEHEAWIDKMVAELGAYSKAGGEVLFGTDVGYTDHFDTTLEFTLMSRAGMTYQQILASLTTNPARRFKSSGHSGRIANGMDADLVVLGADPANDLTAFSNVRYVIRSGKLIFSAR
ncbi:MAG: amidohydrolase family protein [Silvibacterium sp.]